MFSFIKYLQGLKEQFQKNKGLWFTTITVVSILGIILTMYVMSTLTSNVSQKVYQGMSKTYNLNLTNLFDIKEKEFKKIALILSQNEDLIQIIDDGKVEQLKDYMNTVNTNFLKKSINNYKVSVYLTDNNPSVLRPSVISVLKSKNSIYGIEVMADGVFNTFLQPLIKDEVVYAVIEVKESIHNYKKFFDSTNDEYAFLLDKKMLSQMAIETKNGKYRDMVGDYVLAQTFYDTKFTATIPEMGKKGLEKLLNQKYIIDGLYYRTHKVISDINGAEIGVVILGEYVDKEDGFVNLADNMTKTVTTVALGLVISIMLFMF